MNPPRNPTGRAEAPSTAYITSRCDTLLRVHNYHNTGVELGTIETESVA